MDAKDSIIFLNYLNNLNLLLKDSLVNNCEIPDSIYTIIQNFKKDHLMVPYLKYYQLEALGGSYATRTWYFLNYYVFDIKAKKIIFYEKCMGSSPDLYWILVDQGGAFFDIFFMFRSYNKFINQNKKYLKTKH
ncbi:MAG: hypothetical protein JSU07_09655 [Bacteroidetes bacterium]|nr:hypothetical protein [Bacteroidota bacterium]